jgi:hypothetical protein
MTKNKDIRDCPKCESPLLVLYGFDGVVVSHECAECDWKTPLRELVASVLFTLTERRPYKHDLSKFEDEHPGGYEEMLQTMEWHAVEALKRHGVSLGSGKGEAE